MHPTQFLLPLALSLLRLAAAQSSNTFQIPPGFSLTAGQPTTLKWSPDTPGTVSLYLRTGASSALDKGQLIKGAILPISLRAFLPVENREKVEIEQLFVHLLLELFAFSSNFSRFFFWIWARQDSMSLTSFRRSRQHRLLHLHTACGHSP